MFKKWLAIFKKDTLIDKAISRSGDMLRKTSDMFEESKKVLRFTSSNQINIDIKSEDVEINKFEREVRRDVLKHLVFTGNDMLPSGLTLISIIIDIERIGDYTKNIVELAQTYEKKLHGKKHEELIVEIETAVKNSFANTRECFVKGDKEIANTLLNDYRWVNRKCDEILMELVKETDPNISSGEAAALALYTRWLKRINSHLRNITTSVTNPFDRIGFKPKSF